MDILVEAPHNIISSAVICYRPISMLKMGDARIEIIESVERFEREEEHAPEEQNSRQ